MVDEAKYKLLSLADYYLEYFTTDPNKADFIHVISKNQVKEKLSEGNIIIVPTGLCNCTSIEIDDNYYVFIEKSEN